LRTRASLADSERRRFKEERKWAISQGNVARASQMKWQVKRYTALMQSFHREADAKLLEASAIHARQNVKEEPRASPSGQGRLRRDEQTNGRSDPCTQTKRQATTKQAARDPTR